MSNGNFKNCVLTFFTITLTISLSACQTITNPEKGTVIANPTTPVVKNITSFTNPLRCMDDLFLAYGKRNIVITSDGLPDQTGQVQVGSKEMMITTISKMSTKSRAFKFVDVEQAGPTVFYIQKNWVGTKQIEVPDYYIRGAVTQADLGVSADSQSAGIAAPFVSLGYSRDQMVALVSMDMNIGNVRTRQILPGLHTSNTITIVRSGTGADVEGLIQKASVFFEVSNDRSQGTHQAVRTLIELGLIEVLGKFTKVPYWRCLEIESTNPEVIAQARDWYDGMSKQQHILLTQRALTQAGKYNGVIDGNMSRQLKDAINRYKSTEDLIANGRVDFDLYYRFLVSNLAVVPDKDAPMGTAVTEASFRPMDEKTTEPLAASGEDRIGLEVKPVVGQNGAYRVNDEVRFSVSTKVEADVYCYYEGSDQPVARIFPSRFQPEGRLRPGEIVTVPPAGAPFSIRPVAGGTEQIACIATDRGYSQANRPAVLDEPDLTELSARRLYSVVNQHQNADKLNSSIRHFRFEVRPNPAS